MGNFLQEHYNRFRNAGGQHIMYVIENDLEDDTAQKLKKNFESTNPPVPEEKVKEFEKRMKEAADKARLRDDMQWFTGTGYYSQ